MGSKRSGLRIKSGVRGGIIAANHNVAILKVRTGLRGGKLATNHNVTVRARG